MRSNVVAIIRLFGLITSALTKILIIVFEANIIWFATAVVLETLVVSLSYYLFVQKEKTFLDIADLDYSFVEGRRLLSFSWPLVLSGLVGTLYFQLDKVLIFGFLDEATLGRYALLVQVVSIALFGFTALNTSAIPILNKLFHSNIDIFWKKYQEITAFKFLLSFFICVPFITVGNELIVFLVGDEFYYETELMLAFSAYIVLVSMGALKTEYCVLIGVTKPLFIMRVISLASNAGLNLVLIPMWGLLAPLWQR